jgi:hypothetical protein
MKVSTVSVLTGAPGRERQRRRRRTRRHDAHDLGRQSEQIADRHQPADARAHADGHVHDIELAGRGEQLVRVRRHAEAQVLVERWHGLEAALLGDFGEVLARRLEVDAVFDQFGAEAVHRRVLVRAVAVRHDDRDGQSRRPTGEREALPVIAAGGADDPANLGSFTHQAVDVDQAAAHLERAGGRAVLVLDPHLGTEGLAEQGPHELRRRGHVPSDDTRGFGELVAGEVGHAVTTMSTRTSCASTGISSTS